MENLTENQKTIIINILSELTGVSVDQIDIETNVKDSLGMDSLDLVEAFMKLEEEFGCTIPDEDYEFCKTVGDVFKIVANRIY